MKPTLLTRMQGIQQEVCQLFVATLCRKPDVNRQSIAVWSKKWQKKATGSDASGFLRDLVG